MLGGICFTSFVYLSCIPDTDDFMTFIAVFCLLHYSFVLVMKINVWHSIEQSHLTHPLTNGIHDSRPYVPKADILNT